MYDFIWFILFKKNQPLINKKYYRIKLLPIEIKFLIMIDNYINYNR